jgi:hypothetical protein
MKRLNLTIASAAAAVLLAQPVLADTLAPGKPAGVRQALQGSGLVALGVGAVIVGAVVIAVASGNDAPAAPVTPPVTTTTTTTTTTTG